MNIPLERPRTNQDKPHLEKHFKIQTKLQESNSTFITYCLNTAFPQMCSIVVQSCFQDVNQQTPQFLIVHHFSFPTAGLGLLLGRQL